LVITLPDHVKYIIKKLHQKGYEAYAVGGCVRDSILGREPNDWDITTSAMPSEIKSAFKRTVDTGIEHGTVTVLIDKEAFEVTTFREDNEYKDFRHPSSVEFVKSLYEDLKRRDFTINAMAYSDETGIIDPFNGLEDLKAGIVRCVGEPFERFSEDALRILRAVRFSAQLSFDIDTATQDAISSLSHTLKYISAERICTELVKLIVSPHPEYIIRAYELGVTRVFFKEFDIMMETPQNSRYHIYSVGGHTVKAMQNIEADRILRLTMLLHDIGKPNARTTDKKGTDHFKGHGEISAHMAKNFMRRLNMDNDTIKKVTLLIRYHDWRFPVTPANVRYAVSIIGKDLFPSFIKIQTADTLAKSDYGRQRTLENISEIKNLYKTIIAEEQCVSVKELKISGSDILALGCPPGPQVGALLNEALKKVIDDPSCNDPDFLTEYIKKLLTEENYERN
jgi:tRNA nucleotidyltransferase (CCA-adding enzyme)